MLGVELPVHLGEQHARVVGALDGAVLAGAAHAGEVVHHALLDAAGVGLLGGAAALVIEGHEEERLVLHQRSAQGEAGLVLVEVGLGSRRPIGALGRGGEPLVLEVAVHRAVDVVRSGLGHDVHEPARAAAELRGRAFRHHDHFLHRVEVLFSREIWFFLAAIDVGECLMAAHGIAPLDLIRFLNGFLLIAAHESRRKHVELDEAHARVEVVRVELRGAREFVVCL